MRRLRRSFAAVLLVLFTAWLAVAAFLLAWPREDELPERADAVVVLAGDADLRIPRGLAVVERGVADTLVLSTEDRGDWPGAPLCAAGQRPFDVVCFDAVPPSTSGEAKGVRALARERGWGPIVVVTSRYHVFRSRLLFRRCLGDGISVVGSDYDRRRLPLILALETAKLIWAVTVERGC